MPKKPRTKGKILPKKVYRPKANAEGLSLTAQVGGDVDGRALDVTSWPHETEDAREQAILDAHPLVTDQPAPKKKENG